ncbi:MAG: tandem-95 repeat protein, partial [Variovorax sp.]
PVSGNVLTNDTDVDSVNLTVTQFVFGGTTYTAGQTATLAGVGTLVIGANGSYTFTPAANYTGAVPAATYTVSDGALTSTATLSVAITPVNDAPVGVNDTATTPEDTPVTGNVLTNDTDVDSANLTVTQFVVGGTTYTAGQTATLAGVGTLVINANGSYTFAPALNYNGPVPVATYTVSDGALTSTATLTVTVTPVNDAPVAVNDNATTIQNASVSGNVLANDTDVDSANLTVTQFVVGGTTYTAGQTANLAGIGTLVINPNGTFTFTPAFNYNGAVPVATYTVSDGALSSTAALSVTITALNAPVGVNDTATTLEDNPVSGNVLTNDTDVDSVNLTVTQFVIGGTTYTAGQTATLAGVGTLVVNANGTYTFTPALNYSGAVPVATYTVSDGALTSTATLTVTITPVNDAPVGVNDTATTPEDTPVSGNVLTNDTDVDSATLTVTQFVVGGTTYTAGQTATLVGVGTLVVNANGSYTFTPALNYNGPVPAATYTVSDGALTSTATLTISVTPVNDAPVGVNDTATTPEDTPVTGNVLTNDTDVDNVNLTVTQFVLGGTTYTAGQTANLAGVGTLVINANGSYTFTPALNYNGPVPVATYTVSDGALTSTATLTVAITPVNDAPVGVNDTASTPEDTPVSGNVLTNDTDIDSANLTVTQFVVGGTTYAAGSSAVLAGVGTLVINANGTYTFTPALNYNGPVPAATYTVSDGALTSTATLTVTVTPVNDAPVGVNDTAATPEDTPVSGNVLTNDTDVDNVNLTVTQFVVGGTTYSAGGSAVLAGVGTLVINADGSYTFTPALNYNGPVPAATYTVTDGALTSTATLAVTVTPVNDAPVGVNDTATTLEDTPVSGNVLTNDTDVDSANLTVTQFVVGGTTYTAGQTATLAGVGTLVINTNGGYTFTPALNYTGPVPVATYTVTDGALTSTATLTVTITPVNDAPVGVNDTGTTLEDAPVSGNVLTNDTDIDSANLAVTQFAVGGTTYTAGQTATLAGVGTLVINANGGYTFTPALNYNGPVPVATYTVTDGALTSTATLTVTITPVNDAPVGVNDTATTPEDTPVSGNVLTNDTDIDSANLTVTQFVVGGTTYAAGQTATLAGVGTLVINTNGTYTFTPALNYNGPVPVATYTVSDGALTSTATLTVAITPVNDAPVGVNDTATAPEDTPVSGNVLTNDTDVD